MARLLENYTKDILRAYGVEIPRYFIAENPDQAEQAARQLDTGTVVKVLIPAGKRGKMRGILFAENPGEASSAAQRLLGGNFGGYQVNKVLVEEKLDIDRELYAAISIDQSLRVPVAIVGSPGGVDIEDLVGSNRGQVFKQPIDPFYGLPQYMAKEIWMKLGLKGKVLVQAAGILHQMWNVFSRYDGSLLEINPLVITSENKIVAAAAIMTVDDNALYRQDAVKKLVEVGSGRVWRPLTERERRVIEVNEAEPYRGTARYIELEGGDIGFMCGGGGGSLVMFNAVMAFGGRPANYTEFGGNPTAKKVGGLARAIISKPGVKGLIVSHSISSNTQVDLVAEGVIWALKEENVDLASFPVVVRSAGVNEGRARDLYSQHGVEHYGDEITLTAAARIIVEKVKN